VLLATIASPTVLATMKSSFCLPKATGSARDAMHYGDVIRVSFMELLTAEIKWRKEEIREHVSISGYFL
jgi:hypothetical protein